MQCADGAGEEIAVLLVDASEENLRRVGERLRASVHALALPHEKNPGGVVTVSIGITAFRSAAHEAFVDVLERADKALYQAKKGGRNRVILGT